MNPPVRFSAGPDQLILRPKCRSGHRAPCSSKKASIRCPPSPRSSLASRAASGWGSAQPALPPSSLREQRVPALSWVLTSRGVPPWRGAARLTLPWNRRDERLPRLARVIPQFPAARQRARPARLSRVLMPATPERGWEACGCATAFTSPSSRFASADGHGDQEIHNVGSSPGDDLAAKAAVPLMNSYSPARSGVKSTGTSSPSSNCTRRARSGKTTSSEQAVVPCRMTSAGRGCHAGQRSRPGCRRA